MKLSREPALTLIAGIAPFIQLATAFLVNDSELQGLINAAAALLAAALTALVVRSERLAPLALGFAQALLAIGIQIGWNPSAEQQAALMSFVGVLVAAYVRTQVVAPVSAAGDPRRAGIPAEPDPAFRARDWSDIYAEDAARVRREREDEQ